MAIRVLIVAVIAVVSLAAVHAQVDQNPQANMRLIVTKPDAFYRVAYVIDKVTGRCFLAAREPGVATLEDVVFIGVTSDAEGRLNT